MTFTRQLGNGDTGIMTTLWAMRAMVDDAIQEGTAVPALARQIVKQAGYLDSAQLRAVFDYLVKHVRFVADPQGVESVRHPDQMLNEIFRTGTAAGDCDDLATLGAALLRAMGFAACLVVVSARASGEFHHVLFGARLGASLITLDPQQRMFNVLPASITRKLVFDLF